MQDIKYTIDEYVESRDKIVKRIFELTEQINKSPPRRENPSVRHLTERRALLYTQKWDLEYAIRELRGYLLTVYGMEDSLNAG